MGAPEEAVTRGGSRTPLLYRRKISLAPLPPREGESGSGRRRGLVGRSDGLSAHDKKKKRTAAQPARGRLPDCNQEKVHYENSVRYEYDEPHAWGTLASVLIPYAILIKYFCLITGRHSKVCFLLHPDISDQG